MEFQSLLLWRSWRAAGVTDEGSLGPHPPRLAALRARRSTPPSRAGRRLCLRQPKPSIGSHRNLVFGGGYFGTAQCVFESGDAIVA